MSASRSAWRVIGLQENHAGRAWLARQTPELRCAI